MATEDSTRGIAAEWWEELREFRSTNQPKRVTVDEVGWEYIASGDGEEALLILPGGLWSERQVLPGSRPLRTATGAARRAQTVLP
jgi:hypothetical protein